MLWAGLPTPVENPVPTQEDALDDCQVRSTAAPEATEIGPLLPFALRSAVGALMDTKTMGDTAGVHKVEPAQLTE